MQEFDSNLFKKGLASLPLPQHEKDKLALMVRLIAPQSEQAYTTDFYNVRETLSKIATSTGQDETATLAAIVSNPSLLFKFHDLPTNESLRPEFNEKRALAAVSPALRLQLTRRQPPDREARISSMTKEMMRVAPNDRIAPEDRKTVHIIGDDGTHIATRSPRFSEPK